VRFALVRKEFHDLRPYIWLAFVCLGPDVVDNFLEQTDQHPLTSHSLRGSWLMLQLLLSFAIGTGLLVREQDNGTLNFLDGLPITRTRMFFTKVWTALAVLMIYPSLDVLWLMGNHLVSRESINSAVHPKLLLTLWALNIVAGLLGLSLGMMLGYLRNLAWAVAATCATALGVLARWRPRLLVVDPTELPSTPLVGFTWPISTEPIAVQLGLSALFLLVAWRVFVDGNSRLARLAEAMKRPLLSALAALATMGAVVAVMWAWNKDEKKSEPTQSAEIEGADFGSLPLSHLATTRYVFAYEGNQARVLAASKRADEIFLEISRDLPSKETNPIDVDITGTSTNTAGTAFWNKIRIAPSATDLTGVLAHETTHVLARRMVEDSGMRELGLMTMFDEGFAQWVEYRYADDKGVQRETDRLMGAVVYARREIQLEDLFEFSTFTKKHDRSLVYPLGAAFIEALVVRYGRDAPAQILGALADKDFPPGLSGQALWQAVFQLAGLDLVLVLDDVSKMLAAWAKERKAEIAALPRLRGIIEPGATILDVRVAGDKPLPPGWKRVVRFRPTAESSLTDYRTNSVQQDRARRSRVNVANDTLCYQPGLVSADRTLFEPWQCAPVKWEADDTSMPERTD
jgi:hypothetical protein